VFFRLPVQMPVRFRALAQGMETPWTMGNVEDLSAGGMKMVSERLDGLDEERLLGGELGLEIEFELLESDGPFRVPATVVWLERGDDGVRRAGVQFSELPAERQAALQQFVLDSCRAR